MQVGNAKFLGHNQQELLASSDFDHLRRLYRQPCRILHLCEGAVTRDKRVVMFRGIDREHITTWRIPNERRGRHDRHKAERQLETSRWNIHARRGMRENQVDIPCLRSSHTTLRHLDHTLAKRLRDRVTHQLTKMTGQVLGIAKRSVCAGREVIRHGGNPIKRVECDLIRFDCSIFDPRLLRFLIRCSSPSF